MPKEKFNEEKKMIAVRIQGLIAQGESITQMMDVLVSISLLSVECKEWKLWVEGKASFEEGGKACYG